MASRQEQRSEETKRDIVSAAAKLFANRGYDAVTMREIAKEAKCSHTTIYIYFKNKESLLHQLSMLPLQDLKQRMESVLRQEADPADKLIGVSHEFIQFCLQNRNMYTIFFMANSARVDVEEQELEINKLRNTLFVLLQQALQAHLKIEENDNQLLAFSRIYFFTLHGIVATYHESVESQEELMQRLGDTFDEAIEVLLLGFHQKLNKGSRKYGEN